jgi:hypothetical protein
MSLISGTRTAAQNVTTATLPRWSMVTKAIAPRKPDDPQAHRLMVLSRLPIAVAPAQFARLRQRMDRLG